MLDGYVVKHGTDGAVLVCKADGSDNGEGEWLPRSTCDDGDGLGVGDTDISVQRWIAEKKGLDF
jgi:hypothetical protein